MNILITGINGFIGKYLKHEILQIDLNVFTLSRFNKQTVMDIKGNFFDQRFIKKILNQIKPKIVIHLAWETTPNSFYNSDNNVLWSQRTIQFINEFFSMGGSKFIFMSSCEEYGVVEEKIRPNELFFCKPVSKYGIEKNKVTNYLTEHYNEDKWVVIRNYFVSGLYEKDEKLISYMIDRLKKNEPIILNKPYDIIDIIDVRDVVNIIIVLIKINFSGIINLGNAIEYSPFDIAKKLKKLYGSGDILFNKNFAGTKNRYIVSDNTKLNLLNIKTKFNLDNTLKKMLAFKDV